MDSLDLLRDARPGDGAASPESMTAARAALMNAIETERQGTTAPARHGARGRRTLATGWRWAIAGATAAAVATALVVSQAVAPAGTPGAPATAAAAQLNAAADRAAATDASLLPGQYRETTITSWQTAWSSYGDGPSAALSNRLRRQIYLPKDPADDWYFRGGPSDLYTAYNAVGRAMIANPEYELSAAELPWKARLFQGPAGVFTRPTIPVISLDLRAPDLALVGDDPQATLNSLREVVRADLAQSSPDSDEHPDASGEAQRDPTESQAPGEGRFSSDEDGLVFNRIWVLLASGTATPAQQSTLFKVLALLPTDRVSTTASEQDGRQITTFDWTGDSDELSTTTISIDSETGLVSRLEQRLRRAQEEVPAGTVMASSEFAYRVLEHAPQGATRAALKMPACDAKGYPPTGYDACGVPEPGGSSFYGE